MPKTLTPEHRARIAEGRRGKRHSPETLAKMSASKQGKRNHGLDAVGFTYVKGYKILTGQRGHPLSCGVSGTLAEHRKVLYDEIGPGPHPCHWECGEVLEWGGWDGIIADHVDGDPTNNDPANLVPSCMVCNRLRGQAGNPIDWHR